MKKGALHFLSRKNQSLFDTNIKIKEIDNLDLVLDSSAIPESGTARVRSRPTVKHYTSSSDIVQGFAVPTPKVPVLPPLNGLTTNGSVSGDRLSNGSAISVPDLVEGEILVPPPPSVAPPPPPVFIPPPDFMGDLDSLDMAALQPPSMPPPKPPSLAPYQEEEYLTSLKPPPMAPPKPPSTSSSTSTSSLPISTPPPTTVPDLSECPKFTPPQPPTERQHRTHKAPPPKPTRLSSIPSIDGPPLGPAPAPPAQNPTPSSFNPQNTAKIYSVPKTSILGGFGDHEKRPKQILLLEDSGSGNSMRVPVQINGKASSVAPLTKPLRKNSAGTQLEKDLQQLKENLQATLPSQTPQTQPKKEAKIETVSTRQEISTPAPTLPKDSPKPQKVPIALVNLEANQVKLEESPGHGCKFSPLIDHKLRNLKNSEPSGAREGPAASPLALLMAAKEREKHRSSLSRENSAKKNGQSTASIQPSDSSPNSFIVIPRSNSSFSLTSQGTPQESQSVIPVEPRVTIQPTEKPRSPALVRSETPVTNPPLSLLSTATPSPVSNLSVGKLSVERCPSPSECVRDEENGEELCMPLLPPPPEFANFDDLNDMDSPPSFPPPDPPEKKALPTPPLPPNACPVPPVQVPSPIPKPKSPAPPTLPPPNTDVKPKLLPQTKSKVPSTQASSSLSASQATLLSILQKKMLEMDQKIVPMKETEPSSDDWGSPLSDEDTKVPVVPRATPKNKAFTLPIRTAGLDMRELESKVAQKSQDKFSSKGSTSNGPPSKHQYGMTFTVRPGTKHPITLYSKGDSS